MNALTNFSKKLPLMLWAQPSNSQPLSEKHTPSSAASLPSAKTTSSRSAKAGLAAGKPLSITASPLPLTSPSHLITTLNWPMTSTDVKLPSSHNYKQVIPHLTTTSSISNVQNLPSVLTAMDSPLKWSTTSSSPAPTTNMKNTCSIWNSAAKLSLSPTSYLTLLQPPLAQFHCCYKMLSSQCCTLLLTPPPPTNHLAFDLLPAFTIPFSFARLAPSLGHNTGVGKTVVLVLWVIQLRMWCQFWPPAA